MIGGSNTEEGRRDDGRIASGDYVIISGNGVKRMVQVRAGNDLRLGNAGYVKLDKLIGMRFGDVLMYDQKKGTLVPSNAYPDLDLTTIEDCENETRDNRHIVDNNTSQKLSNVEIATLRQEKGVDVFLSSLVEKSTTFHSKTAYSQEKYLRRKKIRYGTLYKVERVTLDGLAETYIPTICCSVSSPEETHAIRFRADTLALILHHSDVHSGSRVLAYDKTNGILEAALLSRLGDDGLVLQVMDKTAHPIVHTAQAMGLQRISERWKAVPRNKDFLFGLDDTGKEEKRNNGNEEKKNVEVEVEGDGNEDGSGNIRKRRRVDDDGGSSQWLRGLDARQMLMKRPADSLIVATDADAETVIIELLPFLALGARIVVYSQFLEDMTGIFAKLWDKCVNVCVSETWYRHYQVLPNRTHPTVNMSAAGGYLLTAIKTCTDKLSGGLS